jgi:hypothetical protein
VKLRKTKAFIIWYGSLLKGLEMENIIAVWVDFICRVVGCIDKDHNTVIHHCLLVSDFIKLRLIGG